MTVLTAFIHNTRSGFVLFSFAIYLLLANSAIGQSGVHSRDPVGAAHETYRCSQSVDEEDSCVQTVTAAVGIPASGQAETHPKSHVPVAAADIVGPLSTAVDEEVEPPVRLSAPTRFQPGERFEVPRSLDPYWRPVQSPRRFVAKSDDDADAQNGVSNKFHWRPAVLQSILIQGVQHAYAMAVQDRMRRELKGPFFKDYFRSVRNLHGWGDGNRFFTNYVAHPMQGGMTGFVFVQNHDRLKRQKFAESKTYWEDRLKTMLWSAAWSTQWEIGPFGQAAIGNVGLKKGMAYVDLVVTPTVGTGWMITEEALDRYIIRHLEKRTNFVVKIFLRTILNPMRGVANTLRFKAPWYRDRPFGT